MDYPSSPKVCKRELYRLTSSLPPLFRILLVVLFVVFVSLTSPSLLPSIIDVSTSIVVLDEIIPLKSVFDEILVLLLVDGIVEILILGFSLPEEVKERETR